MLFRTGDACEGYLLVLEGSLRVSLLGEGGHAILLYGVGPGESCVPTTTCLLGRQAYPADDVVETRLEGLLLPPRRSRRRSKLRPPSVASRSAGSATAWPISWRW